MAQVIQEASDGLQLTIYQTVNKE